MKAFLDQNFLLQTETAQKLYHEHAKKMPIIDYHCHLPPDQIAADKKFRNLTEIWLYGDHYKWRAMRSNGVAEKYCTGDADDLQKFKQYAATVPYTLRNPLYHWTHLELQRYFGIDTLLNEDSAEEIYYNCTEQLQQDEMSCRNLLRKMNVKVVCTTDDPVHSLEHHAQLREEGFEIKVLPTFRADKAMAVDHQESYNTYLNELENVSGVKISHYDDLLEAIRIRHDFFAEAGCKLSDHGIENFIAEDYTQEEVKKSFQKIRSEKNLDKCAIDKLKSAILYELAKLDHEKGWTQQFHVGAMRNNSSRMMKNLGPDTGFDSIGDYRIGTPMSRFFDRLDSSNQLAKTIIYNLNPRDNYLVGTMIGNFNDGSTPGKMQFGSGWWFLDQKEGMEMQMNALSNLGLLGRFVGMLTDSRSFLSYPRHEYFRRILCNLLGNDVENGELPHDMNLLGQTVENISYNNAKSFFNF
ncbi:glucuronate isomerase [Porifericola rhodea]|uniref:glucuronate isomerase n=1 Tax=Porifericola rhodea TaxID=930972 RepID=UPI002666DA13|nr:glucuronate isomerase [Porifericola rhodea]WKN30748.1 glucuronate isomerase [Porifericola rhodea]